MTMQSPDPNVLDLASLYPPPSGRSWSRRLRRLWPLAATGGILSIGALAYPTMQLDQALVAIGLRNAEAAPVIRIPLEQSRQIAAMTVDDKTQLVIEGLAAQERNALIPVSRLPVQAANAFHIGQEKPETYQTALKCLTQAVYYEAAFEPLQGRRAVAQVVLNRMRHPAYPKSICGVVYQGAERRTGCQFSFTCDGALLRAPAAGPWREAEEIARKALLGHVEKSVGTATHYHADYVLPKWAFELAKIDQLGRHIFYRFNGGWGQPRALAGRYSGIEHIPALNMLALRQRLLEKETPADDAGAGLALAVEPHVTDRHAANDIGGRLDTTKAWRLSIPDPVQASARYRQAIETDTTATSSAAAEIAIADQAKRVEP